MRAESETLRGDECDAGDHYWVLDEKSLGICKKCGGKKQFPIEVWGWQNRKMGIGKTSQNTIH